jgi:hypothetical protein
MAVTANSIVTPQTPWSGTAVCTAANTDIDTPTTTVELISQAANVNGLRIDALWAINRGALASANHLQLYTYDGATKVYIDGDLTSTASAPAAGVVGVKHSFDYSDTAPLVIKAGLGLHVATGVAVSDGVAFFAQGGLY